MSKTLAALALTGLLGVSVALGFAQTAQAAEETPPTLVEVAQQIAEEVEVECQTPLHDAALAATADPNALTDLEAANANCAVIGAKYAYFIEAVEARADAVLAQVPADLIPFSDAAADAVTPEVRAAVEAGDTESAIRILFAAVAPQFDIEAEVGQ